MTENLTLCIKWVSRWLRNNMLTDLLGDLVIIAVSGHVILILKYRHI